MVCETGLLWPNYAVAKAIRSRFLLAHPVLQNLSHDDIKQLQHLFHSLYRDFKRAHVEEKKSSFETVRVDGILEVSFLNIIIIDFSYMIFNF